MRERASLRVTVALLAASGSLLPAIGSLEEGSCEACRMEWAARQDRAKKPARNDAFDAKTGRSLLNYPPHRYWDTEKLRLSLTIADMNVPRADAIATLNMRAIDDGLSEVTLDAAQFEVRSVSVNGEPARFEHADKLKLRIQLAQPATRGEAIQVQVQYTIDNPADGLTWTPENPAWPGRPAQLHSQGQTESNRYWIPCHDSPNERLVTELDVRVPVGFLASSNGELVSRTVEGNSEVFSFRLTEAHVSYLVSLIVGKFDVVTLPHGRVPMSVFVPPGKSADVARTYGRTGAMIDLFESLLGHPYSWPKYDQLVVHNFGAGGMENTSVTTMYDTAVLDERSLLDGDLDGLIAHELGHQWFGDLITCKSWEHIWLNEGFATYLDTVWFEKRADGGSTDWYLFDLSSGLARGVMKDDKPNAPVQPGMASKRWRNSGETFRRAANPYPKGAMTLHMLRRKLGDELFWRGMRHYVASCKQTPVETGDFRRAMEVATGASLEQFFDQWVFRPGVPQLRVTTAWDEASSKLRVTVEQTQNIDADNPAFVLSIPVFVSDREGSWTSRSIETRERSVSTEFELPGKPHGLCVDPFMDVLANYSVVGEPAQHSVALQSAPTTIGQVRAARSILESASGGAEVLGSLTGAAFWGTKVLILEEIARRRPALLAAQELQAWQDPNARVRKAYAEAIGTWFAAKEEPRTTPDQLATLIARLTLAKDDSSYAVRAAVAKSLGQSKDASVLPTILALAAVDSQHDQIRRGALEGLAALDDARALPEALRLASPGQNSRTRATATDAIGSLGHHDTAAALRALSDLAADPEERVSRAAAGSIVKVGDPRGVMVLSALLQRGWLTRSDRDRLNDQIDELAEKQNPTDQPKAPGR